MLASGEWVAARSHWLAFTYGATLSDRISTLIEPSLRDLGFELVQVRLMGQAQSRRTLQVMAEPLDAARTMTVDDCALISRTVSAVLDVDDPIGGAYLLEVSSPGIDRPLVKPADYERFRGWVAKLETEVPLDGRRRFKGTLQGLESDRVVLDEAGTRRELPLSAIKKARLELEDALRRAQEARLAEPAPGE